MILQEEIKLNEELSIEPYQEEKHSEVLEEMRNDAELRHFLARTKGLNIIKKDNIPIGYVFFDELYYLEGENSVSLTVGLKKEYRSETKDDKKGMGKYVISELASYLLTDANFDAVVLETRPQDERMQKVALGTAFQRDWELSSKFYEEGYPDVPYVKRNSR